MMSAPHPQPENPWLRSPIVARWPEILAVVLLTTGPFIGSSTWNAIHGSSHHYMSFLLTDARLLLNVAIEGSLLGLVLMYLRWRGWTPPDFRILPSFASTGLSIPLAFVLMIANSAIILGLLQVAFAFQHEYRTFDAYIISISPQIGPHSIQVGWLVIIAAMGLNACFEEILCTAYMFNQFAVKLGTFPALCLTVFVRMSCHTYEGTVHMLGVGAVFLILGGVYCWRRNLWTIILAHAVVDFVSVAFLKVTYG